MRRAVLSLCLAGLAGLPTGPARAADTVTIVLSEAGGAYAEAAGALRAALPAGAAVREIVQDTPAREPPAQARLVVAVGTKACAGAAQVPGMPVLCALIPRAAFERITADPASRNRTVTALLLDQPPSRQMALIRLALPAADTVAMLFGPESGPSQAAFETAARRHGLRAMAARASSPDDLYPALQRLLDNGSHALLAVPDARVFNAGTVQNILRAAIREQVPLFAFSPAYVRAGALAAVYSTPRQAGRQAGLLAREILAGGPLPAPLPPAEFTVAVNPHVARSLGLDLEDGEALAQRLRAQEKPQ